MKNILLIIAVFLVQLVARAQAPAWQAAMVVGNGNSNCIVTAVATDATGNVYLAGTFSITIAIGTTTLVSAGGEDIFVAKWNPASQSYAWAQRAGGAGYDYVSALAVSGNSVYVTGYYQSSAATFGSTTLPSVGYYDMYVAKLADAGSTATFTWAKGAATTEFEEANAIVVEGSNVYVGGYFNGRTVSFDNVTLQNAVPNASEWLRDTFLVKLNDAGPAASFVWAKNLGDTQHDGIGRLAVQGTNIYLTGYCNGYGSNNVVRNSDFFVAKAVDAGSTGSIAWRTIVTLGANIVGAAVNGNAIYISGSFTGSATFGATTLTSRGNADAYVAKLQDMGSSTAYTWVAQAGGPGDDSPSRLAKQGNRLYLAGNFTGQAEVFGSSALTSVGGFDVFVARVVDGGSAGVFTWAQQGGSITYDGVYDLAVSGLAVYTIGYVGSAASFGSFQLGSSQYQLPFLATLNDATVTAATPTTRLPGLALYPNPAHNHATVQVPAGPGPAALTLLDALGRAVRTAFAPAGQAYALSLTGLAPGVYILRVQMGEKQAVQRVVVE